MSPNLAAAVARFRDDVFTNQDTIDPHWSHDWGTLAMGFLLACGVPREELTWKLLSDLSCGVFAPYLGEPLTPEQWVNNVFANNPEVVTVRLGYGWVTGLDQPIMWMDFTTNTGEHLAASQDAQLITTPDHVIRWVVDNVPLGEWVDYARPVAS